MTGKFVSVLMLVAMIGSTIAMHYKDCGSKAPVEEVNIPGCPDSPCVIKKGDIKTTTITFDSKVTANVETKFSVTVKGAVIPVRMPPGKFCKHGSTTDCTTGSVKEGVKYDFIQKIHIPSLAPKGTYEFKMEILAKKEKLVCVGLKAKVV